MSLLGLVFAELRARPLTAGLHALMLALGVAGATALLLFSAQSEARLQRDARGVDLVVGAKGSPLQLVLSSVFHADIPTGNIPMQAAKDIIADPRVAQGVAIGLGDSAGGFRIVGADAAILRFYDTRLAAGRAYAAPMEAVLGAQAARRLGLEPGSTFKGAHGLGAGGEAHGETYRVVGVLGEKRSVVDRLIFTPLESVWAVHEVHAMQGLAAPAPVASHDPGEPHAAHAEDEPDREATAVLLRLRSPLGALSLRRAVNAQSALMAARPPDEAVRLFQLIGAGTQVLQGFALTLIAAAALSVFVTLLAALRERRGEVALLRVMGATRAQVFALLVGQGVAIAALGTALGLALGHALMAGLGAAGGRARDFALTGAWFEPGEIAIALGGLAAGALAALIPAIAAYRVDIAKTLAETG